MTSRQVKKLMISRSAKGAYTAPEIRFDEYQSSRKMNLIMDRTLDFVVKEESKRELASFASSEGGLAGYNPSDSGGEAIHGSDLFHFQCDFLRQTATSSFDVDYEIDGEGHKEKWDHWKDAIKNESGLKVINIPGEITKKRWWSYLDEQIPKALLSEQRSVYVSA